MEESQIYSTKVFLRLSSGLYTIPWICFQFLTAATVYCPNWRQLKYYFNLIKSMNWKQVLQINPKEQQSLEEHSVVLTHCKNRNCSLAINFIRLNYFQSPHDITSSLNYSRNTSTKKFYKNCNKNTETDVVSFQVPACRPGPQQAEEIQAYRNVLRSLNMPRHEASHLQDTKINTGRNDRFPFLYLHILSFPSFRAVMYYDHHWPFTLSPCHFIFDVHVTVLQ